MGISEDEDDTISERNSGSVVSNLTDRYGFYGGSQYNPEPKQVISPQVILKRERKWIEMLNNWDKMMSKNYKKVRERCRKGIPQSIRSRAWLHLCEGDIEKQNHAASYYADLCSMEGNPRCTEDIKKDLHRQFPFHEMFDQEKHGQQELFNVLKAYSVRNPNVGYSQAQAPIAAFLLMHMPAEDAFWCLVRICEKYLKGYYCQGMESLQIDGDILFAFLRRTDPHIYKHFKKQSIEPILYMTEWFLCVYVRTLPWQALLRVWDMFLCEGVKVLFKVGLILIKYSIRSKMRSHSSLKKIFPTLYETLEALRSPPTHLLDEEFVVDHVIRMNITEEDLRRETERQIKKRKAVQNK